MNNGDNFESKLWDILVKEHLVDFSQFHKSRFFDEIPLFSRETDIEFLAGFASDRANAILLGFALKFLKSVVSYEEHRSPYFAAITVWDLDGADRVVPNLFVWSGPVRQLEKKLVLGTVQTSFGRRIKRLVSKNDSQNRFEVLEDTTKISDEIRMFICYKIQPYQAFIAADRFRKTVNPVRA